MNKMKKLSIVLVIAVVWLTAAQAAAATLFSDGVYTFEKTADNTAVITDCSLTDSEITVPASVLGYPVAGIGDYVFLNNSGVRSITLPASLCSIGEYAFAGNKGLEAVTIPRLCAQIADTAFWNSPNVTIFCYADTAALTYAEAHGIAYEILPPEKTDLSGAVVSPEADRFRYNGKEQRPSVTVTLNDSLLDISSDFTVAYENNTGAGKATVTVLGCGEYTGTASASFSICYVLGDADGDGEASILDATAIQRALASLPVADETTVNICGDIDGDGLNIIDATTLQRWLADFIVPYPIDEMMI